VIGTIPEGAATPLGFALAVPSLRDIKVTVNPNVTTIRAVNLIS
jgi:hypothetical protein